METKQTIKRLETYLEQCKNRVSTETNEHKKAFFDREVNKTIKKLESFKL